MSYCLIHWRVNCPEEICRQQYESRKTGGEKMIGRKELALLTNPLIQKYFGCVCLDKSKSGICHSTRAIAEAFAAYRVLKAMQETIKTGELVLERFQSNPDNEWQVTKCPQDFTADMHAAWLRLPDQFQSKREKCCCGESESVHRIDGPCYHIEKKPDPVELAIKSIVIGHYPYDGLEQTLRELVDLARASK